MANISEPQLIRLIDAHIKKECPNYYKASVTQRTSPAHGAERKNPSLTGASPADG